MFKYLYQLLLKVPKEETNRLTIINNKIVNFASSDENVNLMLKWVN
jgi:hypothetical protein